MRKIDNKTAVRQFMCKGRIIKTFAVIAIMILCGFLYSCNDDTSEYLLVNEQTNTSGNAVKAENTVEGPEEQHCFVYVCGSVKKPGVYEVLEGARVYMLVELAGGFTDDAAEWLVSMAEPVRDGQTIYIPSLNQDEYSSLTPSAYQSVQPGTKININLATKEQLMTLKGIGDAKAEDIISYRNANGNFKAIEDIMNVNGIKEAAYNKIKDDICVK